METQGRSKEKGNQRHSPLGAGRVVRGRSVLLGRTGLLPPGTLQRSSRAAPRRAAAALQHRGQRKIHHRGQRLDLSVPRAKLVGQHRGGGAAPR